MHKSPEREIRKKLSTYKEEPNEDLWGKIMDELHPPKQSPTWIDWTHRVTLVACAIALLTLFYKQNIKAPLAGSQNLTENDSQMHPDKNIRKDSTTKQFDSHLTHNKFENTFTKKNNHIESTIQIKSIDLRQANNSVDGINNREKITRENKPLSSPIQTQTHSKISNSLLFWHDLNKNTIAKALPFEKNTDAADQPLAMRYDEQNKISEVDGLDKKTARQESHESNGSRNTTISAPQELNTFFKKPKVLFTPDDVFKNNLAHVANSTQRPKSIDRNTQVITERNSTSNMNNDGTLINKGSLLARLDNLQSDTKVSKDSTKTKSENKTSLKNNGSDRKVNHAHNTKFYFLGMPTLGYQRIEANRTDNVYIERVKNISNLSFKRLGIRLEAGLEVPISKRFQVNGGILYYQRKQTLEYVEKVLDSMTVTSSTEQTAMLSPQFSYSNKTYEYEVKNIGLHISINYKLSENRFLHLIGTGLEFHKAINKNGFKEQSVYVQDPSVYVFYNLYYRLQYPTEGRLKAIFQPTLNYSFYINKDLNAPFYVKPYGLGLNIGFTYAL